ncbi:MAG: hypothetical protein ACUVWA_04240 [Candidatus Oleimicrobiaceae bacterium]
MQRRFLHAVVVGVVVGTTSGWVSGIRAGEGRLVVLENACLVCSLTVRQSQLVAETVAGKPAWLQSYNSRSVRVAGDGDFALELYWTGWLAPGKKDNADNELTVTAKDLRLVAVTSCDLADGGKEARLQFAHSGSSVQVLLTYQLPAQRPYLRRRVSVSDPKHGRHFLHWMWPRRGLLVGEIALLKSGGFGQPAAVRLPDGGAFWGVEYPAATTVIAAQSDGSVQLQCGHEMGATVDSTWVDSEWVVTGLCPQPYVSLWFSHYVDDIRVAPPKPYLLYNSWYDVRAPEYTERPEDAMNEANVLRIVRDFKREALQKRGIRLDAFVLDDGWDVYKSDWVVRPQEFPRGLAPVRAALDSMGTALGLWLSPIGGYSHRDWRIGWMEEHGYETIGDQMCVAGTNYHALLKERVLAFIKEPGVNYFKWDGIQFSCSEQGHGHPVGVYSRRATMEAMADLCAAARAARPDIFLNITSGTWLSPWWLKYANTIWMQGADYGYANVPSISRRDAAMTYRDHVLYEDYQINGVWFPLANLMTHGIIKGNLQKLGGEDEPVDKFTHNALLYFARGVSMWELYVSPNLLREEEWDALAQCIAWARENFDLLTHTVMIGGHPGRREPYGYAHFDGDRGLVVVRNPFIAPTQIALPLDPAFGLNPTAASLVVERLYPTRHILPQLYAAGSLITVPLQGYETALFEVYPLAAAEEPLVAGLTFEVVPSDSDILQLRILGEIEEPRLLRPELVAPAHLEEVFAQIAAIAGQQAPKVGAQGQITTKAGKGKVELSVNIPPQLAKGELAVLFEAQSGLSWDKNQLSLQVRERGREVRSSLEGDLSGWLWAKTELAAGEHLLTYQVRSTATPWRGTASAWIVCWWRPPVKELRIPLRQPRRSGRRLPPRPWPQGVLEKVVGVGDVPIE